MNTETNGIEIPAIRDEENERPIPSAWRPIIREIVNSFVRYDYHLSTGILGVAALSNETATQIENYIQSYGETLIELPDETWNSSVCIWTGKRWDALIDLWTRSEGRSDLVLNAQISEGDEGFVFNVYMVYVP